MIKYQCIRKLHLARGRLFLKHLLANGQEAMILNYYYAHIQQRYSLIFFPKP